MKTVVMFSGQGSQYVGMTSDLCSAYPTAQALGERANEILGFDLVRLMHEGPAEELTETRNTQPALFLHEAMVLEITQVHQQASAVAGHSLGEYSALYAAGVLSFEDALRLVRLRGELMFKAGEEIPGTMAAVVGMSDEDVESLCQELDQGGERTIVAANFNANGQVVISGSRDYLREILPQFKERGAKIVKELQVSGAFHSPLLQAASEPFTEALAATTFHDARIPVYVNVSAEPLTSAADLRGAAAAQLTAPVRWTQTLIRMASDGMEHYIEVGPGKVLQGLAKRTVPSATLDGIDTAEDCSRVITPNSED